MMKDRNILLQGLSKFVDERNVKKVRLLFAEFHASDLYQEIKDWPIEKSVLLLRLLEEEEAAEMFSEFNPEQQEDIINALTSEEIAEIFEELYTDEAVDILDDLPHKITRKVLKAADGETRTKINSILRYDKNQIGYHMVVDYVAIPTGLTIAKAEDMITSQLEVDELEIVGNIFVYDKNTSEYVGYVTPADIISHDDDELIEDFIVKITPIKTNDDMTHASNMFKKYDLTAVPVVNSKNKLVGLIEADDIIERYREVGDNLLDQAAVVKTTKPYLETTVWELFKSRAGWIIALLIIGALSQMIVLGFQSIWMAQGFMADPSMTTGLAGSALSIFAVTTAMSVSSSINDSAGNTGSQTSSTLVRAIALGQVGRGSYGKAMKKEMTVSFALGVAVALTAFVRIIVVWACFGEFGGYGRGPATSEWVSYMFLIAAIASFSFLITIVLGNFVGAALPMLADKYNIDGAIFSGPVQTTVVDIITMLIYFSLTTIMFIALDGNIHDIHQFADSETTSIVLNLII